MLAKYTEFFNALERIAESARGGSGTDTVLETLLESLVAIFQARGGTLRVLDPATDELVLCSAVGLPRRYLDKGPVMARISLSEIFEESPVIITDVLGDPRVQYPRQALNEGIRTIVAVPLGIMGPVRMVLRLYFSRDIAFSSAEIGLVRAMAQQGALVIRNARYFDSFREISGAIHGGKDAGAILGIIVHRVAEAMDALGAIFWIVDTAKRQIQNKVSHGFDFQSLSMVDYEILEQIMGCGETETYIPDARNDPRIPDLERLGKRRVRTILGVPLPIVDSTRGILAVYFSQTVRPGPGEMDFLRALGEQGAIALHKALRYDENMFENFRQTVEGLALALEAKDSHTHGHSLKVAQYARATACAMGLGDGMAETVFRAGILHDIGKIGMGDRILVRLGKLSQREMGTVRAHPEIGARILAPLRFLEELIPLIRHHHERWDGRGYPDGLQGDEIPVGARIISACDALETMISGRPSMARMPLSQAMDQLEKGAGTRFDPRVVKALLGLVGKEPQMATPLELCGRGPQTASSRPSPKTEEADDFQGWAQDLSF